MNMRESFRGALRRLGEVRLSGTTMWQGRKPLSYLTAGNAALKRRTTQAAAAIGTAKAVPFQSTAEVQASAESARRTVPLPSILTPGAPTLLRAGVMPKPSPVNLRRFAETPIARKAINTIKDRIAGMRWRIQPTRGKTLEELPEAAERITILAENFAQPNPEDSFRSLIEQVLEDVLVGGFGAIELDLTGEAQRPLTLWPVDGASIRIRTDWDGNPASPRYVQSTGKFFADDEITLADEELAYIRLNPRTHTPFGLGKLEVAFETIHEFLSAHRYAARMASNTVVQYALWVQNLSPQHHERLIRWWQDEIEGTGKVPILSVDSKPEVLRFGAGTDADLRLEWQEFLIRMIADAFDLPPMLLGLERDVNRNTATTQYDDAFRTAVVPVARLLAEHLTRDVIAKRLGWSDLEFVFTDVDAPNELEQAQIQQTLIGCGVLTVNEVRRMRGLGALPEKTGGVSDAPELQ
ncbi:MAG: phage portal protein [Candidatus Korobacteraceae bacterium]